MNKTIAMISLGTALSAVAGAQTGTFNFNNAPAAPVDTFTNNGFSMTVSGLSSAVSLNQNQSSVTLNASATNILVGDEHGIGTGPFGDNELRNGAGTPALPGATLLELSNVKGPTGTSLTSLNLLLTSVDHAFNEGFLVYGSTQDASHGAATLNLLFHGMGDNQDNGKYTVTANQLSSYSSFYVTADNGFYSSVLLGSGTTACAQAVPEPMTLAGLGLGAIAFFRRRKNA